ncbi:hypothetical protein ACRALDRAFT_2014594 [Sodiomyces alcalophilus JCM 7366]|uniref:uncharacterized protein n=1 Tax=Sodiomyces alcalophilus JCM 7366 TaxID=591952 RepID=UPI0039B6B502
MDISLVPQKDGYFWHHGTARNTIDKHLRYIERRALAIRLRNTWPCQQSQHSVSPSPPPHREKADYLVKRSCQLIIPSQLTWPCQLPAQSDRLDSHPRHQCLINCPLPYQPSPVVYLLPVPPLLSSCRHIILGFSCRSHAARCRSPAKGLDRLLGTGEHNIPYVWETYTVPQTGRGFYQLMAFVIMAWNDRAAANGPVHLAAKYLWVEMINPTSCVNVDIISRARGNEHRCNTSPCQGRKTQLGSTQDNMHWPSHRGENINLPAEERFLRLCIGKCGPETGRHVAPAFLESANNQLSRARSRNTTGCREVERERERERTYGKAAKERHIVLTTTGGGRLPANQPPSLVCASKAPAETALTEGLLLSSLSSFSMTRET